MLKMKRLDWLTLYDQLREEIKKKTSWDKNELLTLMDNLERDMVCKLEKELDE